MDARTLTSFLNSFLSPMSEIITRHMGTIDKYLGDGIMAFWNAPLDDPDHAKNAVRDRSGDAAELADLNRGWEAEARAVRVDSSRRSHFGHRDQYRRMLRRQLRLDPQRFNYSLQGDPVNLASRLESHHQGLWRRSGDRRGDGCGSRQIRAIDRIDLVAVKGKTQAGTMYTLFPERSYRRRSNSSRWTNALPHAAGLSPRRIGPAPVRRSPIAGDAMRVWRSSMICMTNASAFLSPSPPGPDWDGVFVASEK